MLADHIFVSHNKSRLSTNVGSSVMTKSANSAVMPPSMPTRAVSGRTTLGNWYCCTAATVCLFLTNRCPIEWKTLSCGNKIAGCSLGWARLPVRETVHEHQDTSGRDGHCGPADGIPSPRMVRQHHADLPGRLYWRPGCCELA